MSLVAQLKKDLDKAKWEMLEPHAKRDAIIVVDQDLDIIEVAQAVVKDDTETVQSWMDSKQVKKPTRGQVSAWENNPEKTFIFIIVQPYVLIQEMSN